MTTRLILSLSLIATLFLATPAMAEQKRVFGNLEVHYIVFNATFLTPEVASIYGVTRGRDRALVSIAVREIQDDGSSRPRRAIITGSSSDLVHRTALEFREITERDAVYYIAELRFRNAEQRDFRIQVQADPNRPAHQINFNQTLYTD